MRPSLILPLLLLACLGCQSKDGSKGSNSDNTVQSPKGTLPIAFGAINGQSWQFRSGRAYTKIFNDRQYLVIDLWNDLVSQSCKGKTQSTIFLKIKTIPTLGIIDVGSDPLKTYPVINFMDLKSALFDLGIIANIGYVEVESIGNQITGNVVGRFTTFSVPRTEVAGSFTVPFCDVN